MLKDEIHGVSSYAAWAADSETFFYTSKDEETLRTDKIFRHEIGSTQADDTMVFEEKDETFYTFVYPSKSREYIMIGSTSTMTSEYQFLPSNKPKGKFKFIQKRQRGLEYDVAHFEDMFYISTNAENSTNFKLVKAPVASPSKKIGLMCFRIVTMFCWKALSFSVTLWWFLNASTVCFSCE
jgi:oligopeptidase B